MEIVFVVRERRWLDEDRIYPELARHHPVAVRTTRLRRSRSAELPRKPEVVAEELVHLLRLLSTPGLYRGRKLFVCSAGHWSCLAFARFLSLLRRRPRVYAYNFYLHGLANNAAVRLVLRTVLGRSVRLLVQSEEDETLFRSLSKGVEIRRMPYCQDPVEVEPARIRDGGYVFAGGYTNRDYNLVVRLAERLREVPFVIACARQNGLQDPVPANVELKRDLGWDAFHETLAGSRAVLVPLRERVGSSGQMVTLAAMQLGKPTFVPDVDGVAQYVVDGESGIVYPLGDEEALAGALAACLRDPERLAALGRAAQARYAESFTRRRFDEAVVADVLELAAETP